MEPGTSNPPTCPYCNSLISPAARERRRCPRCGEPLPARLFGDHARAPLLPSPPEEGETGGEREASIPNNNGEVRKTISASRTANRRVAIGFLAVMGGMAILGLVFALVTKPTRKTRDPKIPENAPAAGSQAPADLSTLGYLPAGCDVVGGVHLSHLADSPAGKKLLEQPRPALLDQGLSKIEKWTGVKAEAIDHIVFGIALDGGIPELTAVIRTGRPYRPEIVAANFSAQPLPHHKRPLFRLKLQPVGGGYLWCADERTLVLLLRPDAIKIEDLDRIPAVPRAAAEALAGPLRSIVETHLRQADIWAAGTIARPEALADLLNLLSVVKSLPAVPRSFALGVLPENEVTLSGFLESADAKAASAWKAWLEGVEVPGLQSRRVVTSPAGTQVDFQFRASTEGLQKLLGRAKVVEKK